MKRPRRPRYDAQQRRQRILILDAAGLTPQEIADRTQLSLRTVYRVLSRQGERQMAS